MKISALKRVVCYYTATVMFALSPAVAFSYELAVSNERSNEVWIHDDQGSALRPLINCLRPRGMLSQPDSQTLWVACSEDDTLILVDTRSGEIKSRIPNQIGVTSLVAVGTDRLLASNEGSSTASLIDRISGELIASLPTGFEPDGVAVASDLTRLFVASENAGLVHVFDANSYQQEALLVTDLRPRRIAITGDELWVSSEMGSRVEIFSTSSLAKLGEIIFAPRGFRSEQLTPVDILFSSDGRYAYIALGAANHVVIVDTENREVEKYILVGRRAWGLELSPDETLLYVLNGLSDDMTIIDLDRRRPIRSVRTGLVPHAVKVINQ